MRSISASCFAADMALRAVSSRLLPFSRPRLPSSILTRFPSPNPCLPNSTAHARRRLTRRVQTEAVLDAKPRSEQTENLSKRWKIKMLYDGECPLCMREVNMLKERDKLYNAIKFVDISSPDYDPVDNQDLDYETVMGRIHAILSDGTVVRDIEAFRRLYEEVGLGWIYAVTKYEPIASIASVIYSFWAKYRLQITGRPSLEVVMEERRKKMVKTCSDDKACKK